MKTTLVFAITLLFFAAGPSYVQGQVDPCAKDFVRKISKAQIDNDRVNWKAFLTSQCDTLRIVSDSAYTALIIEQEFYKEINRKFESLVGELDQGQRLRDSMITRQDTFIDLQRGVINNYDNLLDQSNQLIIDANANTTKALNRLKLLKWVSIGGIVLGAGGLLVALAAD